VIGRRDDGYHLLQSVFVPHRLVRHAAFRTARRRRDRAPRPRGDAAADDLCLRAARALQRASGTTQGADISIDKQVPWGRGLGGGSSDAASTLLALNRLWGLDWPLSRLQPIGLAIGADVPFFLGGRNAWVEGIGRAPDAR
jgi:4-diphosphocytidyl-2-C-methyl-D-erythritol kinase